MTGSHYQVAELSESIANGTSACSELAAAAVNVVEPQLEVDTALREPTHSRGVNAFPCGAAQREVMVGIED